MKRDHKIMIAGLGVTAALLIGGGLFVFMQGSGQDRFAQCQSGTIAGGFEMLGGDISLIDTENRETDYKDIFTKPSLLYFGYSFCPDVCPLDNLRNAEAAEILDEMDIDAQPVFISVDAKRDTPEIMREFTQAIDPRILGLTGSQEQVDAAAKAWRVYYKINDQDDDEDYLVDHMTYTYLVLPDHGTVALFSRDTDPQEMADRTACFVKNS